MTHPDDLLDLLFAAGLLCPICEERLATTPARWHAHTWLCAACAADEPCPED